MSNSDRTARRQWKPDLSLCDLEDRLSLSAVGQPPTVITPPPTEVRIPVGTGYIPYPVNINDPSWYPSDDGHMMPGFETDPGELPPEQAGMIMGNPMDPENPGPTQSPTMPSPMQPQAYTRLV